MGTTTVIDVAYYSDLLYTIIMNHNKSQSNPEANRAITPEDLAAACGFVGNKLTSYSPEGSEDIFTPPETNQGDISKEDQIEDESDI